MKAKEKVFRFLEERFDLTSTKFAVTDCPAFPGGTRIESNKITLIFYYDFIRNEIVEVVNGVESARTPYFVIERSDPMGYYPAGI
ncbi:hypothetical protein J31TS4_18630 [Paenibacillus sp. J31TS4]|uniref:hypothetical protein n=1 Tax=Paenibacillus sp. J31TS4 TaxID=2807195 RepID=UPI001B2282B5|nr:hypothetical protein [Paenibacillus sp. J31TS4]GIP38583.1 hypothetical protein J31TS4_18630 [Paenibacillus sp. J31TS4]